MASGGPPFAPAVLLSLAAIGAVPPAPNADPASVLEQRADSLEKANDLGGATAALREALALRRKAPDETAAAGVLQKLGSLEMRRGELDASERDWKECLEIRARRSPGSADEAAAWNGLGAVAYRRGDLDAAESDYGRALAIYGRAAPDSPGAARATANLGLVEYYRGDLDRAGDLFRRALATFEKIDRDGIEAASPLNYLGVLAKTRGDYASSEQYYARALAIFEKKSPASLAVAGMESNLGVLCKERGDLDGAERHGRAALEIRRRLAPAGLDVAASLNNLAELALLRGDPDAALPLLQESLEIKEKLAPDSVFFSTTLVNLVEYRLRKGDPARALTEAKRTLDIRRRFEPGSLDEAEAFALVARAERAGGDPGAAAADYANALAAIEAQRRQVGGAEEEGAVFSSRSTGYYREAIELLHDLHRDEEAFAVLERSRGRELLALSSARDLRVDADAPAALVKERRNLDFQYDRAQQQIARIDPVRRKEEADKLVALLLDIRDRRAAVEQQIWTSSPRLRELESLRALTLPEARARLDPGTAIVSYSVGEKKTLVFAVSSDRGKPLAVAEIPAGAESLSREIALFRGLIQQEHADPGVRAAREEAGRRLWRILCAPVEAVAAGSTRVLVCPDGPLHLLPFSALTADRPRKGAFFAEWRPIHVDLSATLAADRARRRGGVIRPALEVAAFGDPAVSPGIPGESDAGSPPATVVERARRLGPLPASRAEVESVAALFRGASASFVGAEASESRVDAAIPGARFVHFACHAILDPRVPLDSSLVLAMPDVDRPGEDNGLLQAWEIYERVRLRADLVTLSACETALGRDAGGEGLIGLVRAFEFAGARSVLASLWNISDRSTPGFMARFYRGIRDGRPMDEALREAQLGSLREGGSAAIPYSWAAFELFGDWK